LVNYKLVKRKKEVTEEIPYLYFENVFWLKGGFVQVRTIKIERLKGRYS